MMSVLLPILLFGVLVTIHELGHFLTAKWAGVFVERFAIGFGPAIFKKTFGETEYAICLLPLGGYVKMRGEGDEMDVIQKSDAPEVEKDQLNSDPRAFPNVSVWKRMAIVSMGPIFNLVLPVIVFTGVYMVGAQSPSARIGNIVAGMPADRAGLKEGDLITQVGATPVRTWEEMTRALGSNGNSPLTLTYERQGQSKTLTLSPEMGRAPNVYGEVVEVPRIGIDFVPYRPTLAIQDPKKPAASLGFQNGDIVTAVNDRPLRYWWELEAALQTSGPKRLTLQRAPVANTPGDANNSAEATPAKTLTLDIPENLSSLQALGLDSAELYIKTVLPGTMAEEAGLKPGDKLLALNDTPIRSWNDFRARIQANQGDQLVLDIARQGETLRIDNLIPKEVEHKDELTYEKKKQRQLGIASMAVVGDLDLTVERYSNPLKAVARGIQETYTLSVQTLVGLGRLVTGQLSMNALGGPISIFYLAGSSYKAGGWSAFFRILAVLSITLGLINFLPIPVLDGGHLLFCVMEAIKGGPLSLRVQKIAQQAGLAIVLGLMLLTFYVDINRFIVDKIKALFE